MSKSKASEPLKISAIRVQQWLSSWNQIKFNPSAMQSKPDASFLIFSLKAPQLKALTGIYRRSTKDNKPRILDPNIQRGLEEARAKTIRDFVQFGFPWCEMSDQKRKSEQFLDLRKPGWLPTSIVVNILKKDDVRNGIKIHEDDLLGVSFDGVSPTITLPKAFKDSTWEPKSVYPLEVIDGQHRLWAFEDFNPPGDFELPVVAYHGIDRSWQAYLFWTINITPKRIKQSLAFDLYPLLRTEDWLDRFEGHAIYRETRAQELVEALWSHPDSPWYQRINMLGESGTDSPMVSQAAWIRSLMATFIKRWEGTSTRMGGLFGAPLKSHTLALPWSRPMQAAFLILAGESFRSAVADYKSGWAAKIRKHSDAKLFDNGDSAFYGKYSLISTDQGIRGLLSVVNDLCYHAADTLELYKWTGLDDVKKKVKPAATDQEAVKIALSSLKKTRVNKFLNDLSASLASYEWRTSSTPDLTETERLNQAVFRGSSGYRELRIQLLNHLISAKHDVAEAAKKVRAMVLS